MSRTRNIPRSVDELISVRSGDAAGHLARSFAVEALRRPVELVEHGTQKTPTYFRVVHHETTVAYVRPRRSSVRVEYAIPYGRWSGLVGFGFDGAFGPSYAIDVTDADGLPGALSMLDEAIKLASTG
jgi:hypothetical protein